MERFKQRPIGVCCSFTMDEVLNKSVEELIDQGKRFVIVNDDDEEDTDDY